MDIESFAIGMIFGTKDSGGGQPASTWTKLAEQDFTVSTSSTTETTVGTISCGAAAWTKDKIVCVRVRDKAGARTGYFYGGDTFIINNNAANNSTGSVTTMNRFCYGLNPTWKLTTSSNGIYPSSLASNGTIALKSKYNSSYGTIDGTYHVEVYTLEWPDNVSPFA